MTTARTIALVAPGITTWRVACAAPLQLPKTPTHALFASVPARYTWPGTASHESRCGVVTADRFVRHVAWLQVHPLPPQMRWPVHAGPPLQVHVPAAHWFVVPEQAAPLPQRQVPATQVSVAPVHSELVQHWPTGMQPAPQVR